MIQTKTITDIQTWESFIKKHADANFLQSWYWGEFHKRLGKDTIRTGFYRGNKLEGLLLGIIEPAKRGRYMTIAHGPVIDWNDHELVSSVFSFIRAKAAEKKCVFVRIRPQLMESEKDPQFFKDLGLIRAQMHLHAQLTSRLLIDKNEEALLAQMRKTTRYEIRKAQTIGITVSASKDHTQAKSFYEHQLENAARQKFVPFSFSYLHEQFRVFFEADRALLYSAYYNNLLLAQAFIIFYNTEAVYHYGIGTLDGRKYPGSYLIQWEAIKEAKKRELTHYNFWGVAPLEEKTHRFYPVSIFKRGFGGTDTAYAPAMDLVIQKGLYSINYAVERVRKMIRRV
jgi:lipid II:glycine glycyltransferase (peptidoglycan interpeptide bridge formation enzyme)